MFHSLTTNNAIIRHYSQLLTPNSKKEATLIIVKKFFNINKAVPLHYKQEDCLIHSYNLSEKNHIIW